MPDNFEVKSPWGKTWKLSGATELHRLAVEDPAQLERRKEEITAEIINATCLMTCDDVLYKEVRQASLPDFCPGYAFVVRLLVPRLGHGAPAAEQGR